MRISVACWPEPVRLGEQVGVEQAQEVGEAVLVAVVRRGRQQEQVVGMRGQPLGELVALASSSTSSPRPD